MAGKSDIVEQALKLVMGGGDDAAKTAIRLAGEEAPSIIGKADPAIEVLRQRAIEMETPKSQRTKPSGYQIFETSPDAYKRTPEIVPQENFMDRLPRPVAGKSLPLNERMLPILNISDEVAAQHASKMAPYQGKNVEYFYHTGPIYEKAFDLLGGEGAGRSFMDRFSKTYAGTSPRTPTEQNLLNSSLLSYKAEQGLPLDRPVLNIGGNNDVGYPMISGMHPDLTRRLLAGEDIFANNPKPSSFAENVRGNLQGVTADTHNIRGILASYEELRPGTLPRQWFKTDADYDQYIRNGLTPDILSGGINDSLASQAVNKVSRQSEYGPMADITARSAEILGEAPAPTQSLGWFGLGNMTNLKSAPKTLTELMAERIDVTAQKLGITPEAAARLYMQGKIPLMNKGGSVGDGTEIDDDDIDDALRIAKDVGGSASVMMEDAKGNKYDAQGNIIPPTNPGPNPPRSDVTPQSVAAKAVNDPATYDALMERYAIPDRDIAEYEALRTAVGQQPRDIQQMTHVGDRPRRDVTVDMPLFGGEYSMGMAPYDVASNMSGVAQTAYDMKTAPFYFNPITAPIAAGMDVAEGVATNDPLTASLAIAFGPGGKYAKAAGVGATNYFMNPDEAEAGPERWFSKAMEVARAIPMEKMTGQQALAMLRKGVSQEELKWTGADRVFNTPDQITKQDLVDYLKKNRVNTEDVVFGGGNKPTRREDVRPTEAARAPYMEDWNALKAKREALDKEYYSLTPDEQVKQQSDFWSRQYQLDTARDYLKNKMVDATIEEMGGLGLPVRYGPGSAYGDEYMTRGGENYQETLITLPAKEYGMLYKSGHWKDVPNVVGHIRTQVLDVTPPGANRPYKAFNVDEAQSDYAKSGREKGFVTPEDKASFPSLVKQYDELAKQRRDLERLIGNGDDTTLEIAAATKQMIEVNRQMMDLSEEMTRIRTGGVPMAPYVTSTQGWTDLSIKKALDQAMDSDADYFSWSPGEVHAERYDLTKHIGKVQYNPDDGSLFAYDPRGDMVINERVNDPSDLDEYVGKELADKMRAEAASRSDAIDGAYEISRDEDADGWAVTMYGEPAYGRNGDPLVFGSRGEAKDYINEMKANDYGNNPVEFSGLDLKAGGEGMRGYYDKIYLKRVQDVIKKSTGIKPEIETITVNTADGPRQQLGVRITDEMREKARFSDFNKGGRVSNPAVNKALRLTANM